MSHAALTVATAAMTAIGPAVSALAADYAACCANCLSLGFHQGKGWVVHMDKAHADGLVKLLGDASTGGRASVLAVPTAWTVRLGLALSATAISECTGDRGVAFSHTPLGPWCSGR